MAQDPRICQFRSALPRGSDSPTSRPSPSIAMFRSALPRGSDSTPFARVCCKPSFDPRSREGATTRRCEGDYRRVVSIRAPARERHLVHRPGQLRPSVSIRAPARERPLMMVAIALSLRFRSALPRGSDHRASEGWARYMAFRSALPRGSDPRRPARDRVRPGFDPRSREGATMPAVRQAAPVASFDPRSREGATTEERIVGIAEMFRSALPRGSDETILADAPQPHVSIRAPARERHQSHCILFHIL